jgi:hypothetical protein
VRGNCRELRFEIHDVRLEKPVLEAVFAVQLEGDHVRIYRTMDADEVVRFGFVKPPRHPQFYLEADWVDPMWPRTVCLDWQDDDDSSAYYTVRVEQVDGNIAWSSPVWRLDTAPAGDVPGRVVFTAERKEL